MDPRRKCIVLVGMMGSGKSSVGRLLQRRTGLDLFDTDKAVSEALGLTISAIFDELGEERFRAAEAAVLETFRPVKSAIVVTGGGTVLRKENTQRLKELGIVVWLEADDGTLFERATRRTNRPLLRGENPRARLEALLRERAHLYEDAADVRIDTSSMTHDEVADTILHKIDALPNNEA
jgi:shikimate kinase